MADKRKEFGKIYDKYINKIYRFVFLKVNSEEIAQDICSETFLKGWENYKETQNTKAKIQNPQAFLYRIAHNLVVDHYRTKGRTQVISPELLPITDPSPSLEEKAVFTSDLNQIKLALSNIKEDYQNAIIWRYLDDLPIQEVAKMMNKSEETTRVTLSRALKALKAECYKDTHFTS